MKLLIVGSGETGHLGKSFATAGETLGIDWKLADTRTAQSPNRWTQRVYWYLGGRRPPLMSEFGRRVIDICGDYQPDILVATGSAGLSETTLREASRAGVQLVNFSTDDPWNPAHRASWALQALRAYHQILTPRRSNIDDFVRHGVREVHYLPFGYDETLWYPEALTESEKGDLKSEVLFVGGADDDRIPYIEAFARAGMNVVTYGGYWERPPSTRPYARGIASRDVIRRATCAADVSLCLVRRANRDGHVMRSLEAAACGACMLVERTPEHEELFGSDGDAVTYFSNIDQMVDRARHLRQSAEERSRLASAVRARVLAGRHTYTDRLKAILRLGISWTPPAAPEGRAANERSKMS
jgi:spore maturation protein CgeB